MKVVVAVDDSPTSGDLVDVICHRRWPDHTHFMLVSVIEPFDTAEEYGDDNWNLLLRDVDKRRSGNTEKICSHIRNRIENKVPKSKVDFEIRHGDARHEIINCALEWNADKILIGAKGRQICPYNLLGSVSRAVASNAHCSVEIVRPYQPANTPASRPLARARVTE